MWNIADSRYAICLHKRYNVIMSYRDYREKQNGVYANIENTVQSLT